MLRLVVLICGLGLMGFGLVLIISHGNYSYLPFLIWGSVIVIAILCERWRYRHPEHDHDRQWQRTGEIFQDPETGQTVEVHYDPVSGQRRYVRK